MLDNTPPQIKAILQKPGVYFLQGNHGAFFIEVDDKEQIHQLMVNNFQRDGLLNKEGWKPTASEIRVFRVEAQNAH